MTKKQIDKEYQKIRYEIHYNKPNIDSPYPKEIVQKREYLLYAQCALSNLLEAKQKKNKKQELLYEEIYNNINGHIEWKK